MQESGVEAAAGLVVGEDGRRRCSWPGADPLYLRYHDEEWGRPQADPVRLFEKMGLEGFQSGLSWLTILKKRENFRRAFAGFDYARLARFGEADVARLLADPGIVRHRGKIEAVIANARIALTIEAEEGPLAAWLWAFAPDPASRPERFDHATLAALTETADSAALARALKKRGWRFFGPTTAYAFMQAVGMVNDHLEGCFVRAAVEEAQRRFSPPRLTKR